MDKVIYICIFIVEHHYQDRDNYHVFDIGEVDSKVFPSELKMLNWINEQEEQSKVAKVKAIRDEYKSFHLVYAGVYLPVVDTPYI